MPRNKLRAAAVAMIAAGTAMTACTGGTIYAHYKNTRGWERTDTAIFELPPMAEGGTYSTAVGLRINAGYPFADICLIVDQRAMPGGTTRSDTLYRRLIDSRNRALGNGLNNFQYEFHVGDSRLRKGDTLMVAVRHYMKRETLPGIEDIGVMVTRR